MPVLYPVPGRSGFTLLQISIILMVGSAILASTLAGQSAGDYNQKNIENMRKLNKVEERMAFFMSKYGRRPCPANGSYATTSTSFGREASTPGTCTGTSIMGPDAGTGNIIAGVIPTKALDLPDDYAFDAWGRRFTYTIDKRATSAAACYALQSGINSGTVSASNRLQIKDGTGTVVDQTVIAYISHGPDGHGAFPAQGSTVAARINTGSTDADQLTNAGVNAAFTYNTTNFTNTRIRKERNSTFDDLVYYHNDSKNLCCIGAACAIANQSGFWIGANGMVNTNMGTSILSLDINGDGIPDLVIADSNASPGSGAGAGAVYVVFGSRSFSGNNFYFSNSSYGFEIDGANASDALGSSLAAGDVNGDGIQDLIIGASGYNGSAGATYVVLGGKGTWPASFNISALDGYNPASPGANSTNGFIIMGVTAGDLSGYSVAAGDINGDKISDIIIGAPFATSHAGKTYVVFGGTGIWNASMNLSSLAGYTGTNGTSGFEIRGAAANDYLGWSVASGDISGDGIADIIMGAPQASPGGRANAGKTYIMFGGTGAWATPKFVSALNGSTGVNGTAGVELDGVTANDVAGKAVSAGDLNGDGIADVVIGAPNASPLGRTNAGSAYIVYGKSSAWAATFQLSGLTSTTGNVFYGVNAYDGLGNAVSAGCDTNGDGIPDLILGAPNANVTGSNPGAAYLVFGSNSWSGSLDLSTLDGSTGTVLQGITDGDGAGTAVTTADIYAQGKCAPIISSPWGGGSGMVYVVPGQSVWPATLSLGTIQ